MNATTPLDAGETLRQIQARADAATPGPWVYSPSGSGDPGAGPDRYEITSTSAVIDERTQFPIATTEYDQMGSLDAEFIAAARRDVPALVAALRTVLRFADGCDNVAATRWQSMDIRTAHTSIAADLRGIITSALSEVRP